MEPMSITETLCFIGISSIAYSILKFISTWSKAREDRGQPLKISEKWLFALLFPLIILSLPGMFVCGFADMYAVNRAADRQRSNFNKLNILNEMKNMPSESQAAYAKDFFNYDLSNGSYEDLKRRFYEEIGLR
ncbi:MAG: hypothetical protein IJS31_05570 [Oscillospiraceae bacterium]|nr:hypothetical protein [Oscillospiraceae bacterium]